MGAILNSRKPAIWGLEACTLLAIGAGTSDFVVWQGGQWDKSRCARGFSSFVNAALFRANASREAVAGCELILQRVPSFSQTKLHRFVRPRLADRHKFSDETNSASDKTAVHFVKTLLLSGGLGTQESGRRREARERCGELTGESVSGSPCQSTIDRCRFAEATEAAELARMKAEGGSFQFFSSIRSPHCWLPHAKTEEIDSTQMIAEEPSHGGIYNLASNAKQHGARAIERGVLCFDFLLLAPCSRRTIHTTTKSVGTNSTSIFGRAEVHHGGHRGHGEFGSVETGAN